MYPKIDHLFIVNLTMSSKKRNSCHLQARRKQHSEHKRKSQVEKVSKNSIRVIGWCVSCLATTLLYRAGEVVCTRWTKRLLTFSKNVTSFALSPFEAVNSNISEINRYLVGFLHAVYECAVLLPTPSLS